MNFLGSPLWSGIGVIVAIVLGAVATALTLLQLKRAQVQKILAYDIISDAPVATVNDDIKSRITILLDNSPIENARLVVVKLANAGNTPIQGTDYENNAPVIFDFGAGTEVLNIDVLETVPSSLRPSFSFNAGQILLRPLLLNSQDVIKFKALLANFSGELEVKARISGVKEILLFDELPENIAKECMKAVLRIGSPLLVLSGLILNSFHSNDFIYYIYIFMIVIGLTLTTFFTFKYKK